MGSKKADVADTFETANVSATSAFLWAVYSLCKGCNAVGFRA
jgi:hypothetical protein